MIWTWTKCGSNWTAPQITIDLLETQFGERVISQYDPVNCRLAAGLCDLTQMDYFLWGYIKLMVYANKPETIDELHTNIECVIAALSADLPLKTVENWAQRLDLCKRARNGHVKEIEYHRLCSALIEKLFT
uniref:Uncharacterized protein n=1 Tax=Bactrocera latifrons TaxID=174628 RepID=A0A0K8W0U7_BACLA